MKRLVSIGCLLGSCLISLAAKEYSFSQAYERTLATHDALAAARQQAQAAKQQQSSARGLYFPSLGVKGSFTRINDPIAIDLNGIRSTILPLYPSGTSLPSFNLQVQDDQFFKAQAYASLPVYTGGKIASANAVASANYAAVSAQADALSNQLLVELVSKYFGDVLAAQTVEVRKQFLQNAEQNAQDAVRMFRVGVISKVEKMSVDVTLSQAQRDYTSALNEARMAQALLRSLLTETAEVTPQSSLFVLPVATLPSLEEWQCQAQRKNPTLSALASKKDSSLAQEKAQRADFLPSVYLFGTRELYTHDLTLLEPDWAYGVGFAWNLFEGGQTYHKTQAARALARQAEELRLQQAKDITTGLEYYYKQLQNAWEIYTALEEEIAFTQTFYQARQTGFRAGTATSMEVNTALAQWQKARLDSLKAQYEFVTALAALCNLSGQPGLFEPYMQGVTK